MLENDFFCGVVMLITWGVGGGSRGGNGNGAGPAGWSAPLLAAGGAAPRSLPHTGPTNPRKEIEKLLNCFFLERKMGITGVPFGRTELSLRLS